MRSLASLCLVAAVLVSACGPTREAAKPAADTTAAVTPPPTPQAIVTVLYLWPKDTAKFEKYYPTHLKIVGDHQQEIGFTKAELTKFISSLQGSKPEFYRQA
jgi:ABC-type glycerol-3-phosphate transport system substrate-binding protein